MRQNKKENLQSDFFKIDEFSLNSNHGHSSTPRHDKNTMRLDHDASELDRLIREDAAAFYAARNRERAYHGSDTHATVSHKNHSTPTPSSHVLDLRKSYLIQKYNLDVIHKPPGITERMLFKIQSRRKERVEWHYPLQKKTRSRVYDEHDGERIPSGRLRHHPMMTVISFSLVLLVVLSPIPGFSLLVQSALYKDTLVSKGRAAMEALVQGVSGLQASNFTQAKESLQTASKDFGEIHNDLTAFNGVLLQVASVAPVFGNQVQLAEGFASIGQHMASALALFSQSIETSQDGRISAPAVQELRNHMHSMLNELRAAKEPLTKVDVNSFEPGLQENMSFLQNNIDTIIKDAEELVNVFDAVYYVMGGEQYARHLVVFQNNNELRPTGGFMGSYALVDVSNGSIKHIEFPPAGIYDLTAGLRKKIVPPRPLSIVNDRWQIWDANWWPDFETSAKKIAWFYMESGGPSVDGVIAVNSDMVVDMLRIVGPLPMPEYGITVTAGKFF